MALSAKGRAAATVAKVSLAQSAVRVRGWLAVAWAAAILGCVCGVDQHGVVRLMRARASRVLGISGGRDFLKPERW